MSVCHSTELTMVSRLAYDKIVKIIPLFVILWVSFLGYGSLACQMNDCTAQLWSHAVIWESCKIIFSHGFDSALIDLTGTWRHARSGQRRVRAVNPLRCHA